MLCKDVMLTLIFDCKTDTTALDCAQMMRDQNVGFAPVTTPDGSLLGVITDRDLAVRVLAEGRSPRTQIGDIMSSAPFLVCKPNDDLIALEQRMAAQRKSRALVQDERGRVVGVISLSDVARAETSDARTAKLFRDVTHRESALVHR